MSKVPELLRRSIGALVLLAGLGGGTYLVDEVAQREAQSNAYIQAVAADPEISDAVRIAMVLGSYYESSNRHIGKPYVDKAGKGQPLTVCNGLTGPEVVAGRYYSPGDCFRLEKARYIKSEAAAKRLLRFWGQYDAFARATFIDFIHNKGEAAFATSTMLGLANAGYLERACRENQRWNKGTVNGVQQVLPGLRIRGDANGEICEVWRLS